MISTFTRIINLIFKKKKQKNPKKFFLFVVYSVVVVVTFFLVISKKPKKKKKQRKMGPVPGIPDKDSRRHLTHVLLIFYFILFFKSNFK